MKMFFYELKYNTSFKEWKANNKYFEVGSTSYSICCKHSLTLSSFTLAIASKPRRLAYNLGSVSLRLAGLIMIMMIVWIIMIRENMIVIKFMKIQGAFFDWSAQKMTKSQPLKEFSELALPKKRLRMKKFKYQNCSELFLFPKWPRKKFK